MNRLLIKEVWPQYPETTVTSVPCWKIMNLCDSLFQVRHWSLRLVTDQQLIFALYFSRNLYPNILIHHWKNVHSQCICFYIGVTFPQRQLRNEAVRLKSHFLRLCHVGFVPPFVRVHSFQWEKWTWAQIKSDSFTPKSLRFTLDPCFTMFHISWTFWHWNGISGKNLLCLGPAPSQQQEIKLTSCKIRHKHEICIVSCVVLDKQ